MLIYINFLFFPLGIFKKRTSNFKILLSFKIIIFHLYFYITYLKIFFFHVHLIIYYNYIINYTYHSSLSDPDLRLVISTVTSATSASLARRPLFMTVMVKVRTSGGISSKSKVSSKTGSCPALTLVLPTFT